MSAKLATLANEVGMGKLRELQEAPGERAHVLIVDDENGPRQALRMLLKEQYDVQLANDVPSALETVERFPVDVIVTDIRMPKLTGVDLLQRVKQHDPDIQVIILTGYGQLETAMKAVEFGAFAYMEKPFDNDLMLRQVQSALARRRREQERRQLEQLALEANRFDLVGRVVSGLLHDLSTPLSVIGSHLELLLFDPDRSELDGKLNVMHEQVLHCSDIVRSTMNFLRHPSPQQNPMSLNEVVKTCLDVGKPLMRRQRVEVSTNLAEDLAQVQGDFILLRQAVLNLLTNACQAMQNQADPQRIGVATWNENGQVYLSVADTGPGIPVENRQKVFDTFFSTKGKLGTGLGLAVVRNVLRQHNGDINVVDTPSGRGATFVMRLPAI
jgi:signal transduction histidine kinase